MKKLVFIIFVLAVVFACDREVVQKPKHLLEEKEMVNILYDLSLLQALKSVTPKVLDENHVDARNYIYKKYSIDSLTFVQNHIYYASSPERYEVIQKKVSAKLKAERAKFNDKKKNVKANASKAKGDKTSRAIAIRDSLQKAVLRKAELQKK
jgi:hypothetical protein